MGNIEPMSLSIVDLQKSFGNFPALHGINLDGRQGEFLALLGPSGSGKTTLLRILAGLEFPDSGQLLFGSENLLGQSARDRRVGMVFQHYALFRHMTVAQNVAFGLAVRPRRERPSRAEIRSRVEKLLQLVQLQDLGRRYPNQLSGGQRQRVALARALAIEPRLLLLDEPFGALDAKVRKELRRWLRGVHDQTGVTTLFVTHDQEEALDLADRVVLLNSGRVEQIGRPHEVYSEPATAFVYEFLGNTNRFEGEVTDGRMVIDGITFPFVGNSIEAGPAVAYARPHELTICGGDQNGIAVEITGIFAAGPLSRLETRRLSGRGMLEVELPREINPSTFARGQHLKITAKSLRVFPK